MSRDIRRPLIDPNALTDAEETFLRELCAGTINLREVAARLGVTPRTAINRSRAICHKLGVPNWRDAVALRRGQGA
jgi:DNA-binding CsgD family transcriptional regulator